MRRVVGLILLLILIGASVMAVSIYGFPDDDGGSKTAGLANYPYATPPPVPAPLASAAYKSVAAELPGVGTQDIKYVHQSILDASWASARITTPEKDRYYAIFLHKEGDSWRADRSVLIDAPDHPQNVKAVLGGIPQDLVDELFALPLAPAPGATAAQVAVQVIEKATGRTGEWSAGPVQSAGPYFRVHIKSIKEENRYTDVYLMQNGGQWIVIAIGQDITAADAPGFPLQLVRPGNMAAPEHVRITPPDLVWDGSVDRNRVERSLQEARQSVVNYPGVAGFYVRNLKDNSGYGVRPDEVFFSASVIKVPVMVAVYRRIEEGKLSYRDTFPTTPEDWAAGAGGLQWNPPGTVQTVEDYLWLMITQSDNVATNVLVRLVGGPDYVNEVAHSLGADHTLLFQKVSSERAAVPGLDNRTTPRDMATILEKIASGKAANAVSTKEMVDLLRQNNLEWWIEAGVPKDVKVANKGGWIDGVFNDAGIVEYKDRPYVLVVLTKYGPEDVRQGDRVLKDISRAVWTAESGKPPPNQP